MADPEVPAETPTTTAPKQSRPRVAAPAGVSRPGVSGVTPAPPAATASGGARGPSHRLTWVLQLLRQLDAAAVAV